MHCFNTGLKLNPLHVDFASHNVLQLKMSPVVVEEPSTTPFIDVKSYVYPGGATIIVGTVCPSFVKTPLLPPICDISISYFMVLILVPVSVSKSNPTYLHDVAPSHCSRFDCRFGEKRLRLIRTGVSVERSKGSSG